MRAISEAPKNGTEIIGYDIDGNKASVVSWMEPNMMVPGGGWFTGQLAGQSNWPVLFHPTHFCDKPES